MKQFVETIRVQDGALLHFDSHLERLRHTMFHFFGTVPSISMRYIELPEVMRLGTVKCRILYSKHIESVEFQPYQKRLIRSLKIVHDDAIDYGYKSTDRKPLQQLLEQKQQADEIIIVKNGFVTDSSFSNLLFENEEGFFLPDTFLLNGIQRQSLLRQQLVREIPIREEDIPNFSRVHLVNAMLHPGEMTVDIQKVI
jgi:4-amino-4-deoxychorismate lyase